MPSSPRAEDPEPADRAAERGWKSWYPILILVPALLALLALVSSIVMPSGPEIPSVRGVRLGMTPDQVRERFEGGAAAAWRTELAGTDLTLIRAPGGTLDRETRFEFHNGMLVAIRLDLPEGAAEGSGERLVITTGSVTERTASGPGRVQMRVLARDCPTHADEVSRILADAP